MTERIKGVLSRVDNVAGRYTKRYAVRAFDSVHVDWLGGMTTLEWLVAYLEGIGEENLKEAVRQGTTLWEIFSSDPWLRENMLRKGWWTGMVDALSPQELADVVREALLRKRPEYAKILPKKWLEKSFQAYLEARWATTASGRT